MKVIEPGHLYELYELDHLDDDGDGGASLRFVKRVGEGYPGNEPPAYPGTNMQEVLRALIDRLGYVREQARALGDHQSVITDEHCIEQLRDVLWCLEARAQRRAGRPWPFVTTNAGEVERIRTCPGCGHIGCEGTC